MRKFLFIIFAIAVVLLLFAFIAVQAILSSDLPRKQTEKSLREKLGTQVSIKQLQTSWNGDTKLKGVSIRIPPKQRYVLDIDYIRVKHNHILDLLLSGLRPSSIYAEAATVRLHQGSNQKNTNVFSAENARIEVSVDDNSSGSEQRLSRILIKFPGIANIEALARRQDQQIEVKQIDGTLFGGYVSGKAVVDVNQWEKTQINASWRDVDLRELRTWRPQAEQTLGVSSGNFEVRPSELNHPREPLSFEGNVDMKEGIFSDLNIQRVSLSGAVGPKRILITNLEIPALGGTANIRARLSKKAGEYFFYTNWNLSNIDVNQAAEALSEDKRNILGQVNGKGYFMTSMDMDDMSGSLKLSLKESNLANTRIIGALYNSLNLKLDASKPEGYGKVELRFTGTKLQIIDFYYFNRGVEIRGTGIVSNLSRGKSSPVEGIVLATTRPLKDIDLPGLSVLDKFLYFAQKEITAVKVGGTLGDVQVNVVALPEVQSTLGRLFGPKKSD